MIHQLKKELALEKSQLAWGGGLATVFSLFLSLLLNSLGVFGEQGKEFLPIGIFIALGSNGIVLMIFVIFRFSQRLQTAISMSIPRRRFLAAAYQLTFFHLLLCLGLGWAVYGIERIVQRLFFSTWALGALPSLPLIFLFSLGIGLLLAVFGLLNGTLLSRFGMKGFTALMILWVGLPVLLPIFAEVITQGDRSNLFKRLVLDGFALLTRIPWQGYVAIGAGVLALLFLLCHRVLKKQVIWS